MSTNILMNAKHFDADDAGEYLSPAVKKKWFLAPYSPSYIGGSLRVGKHRWTSVPDMLYHALGGDAQVLTEEGLEHHVLHHTPARN